MGHTMGVHKDIYQQRQVYIDIFTMGKILRRANGLEEQNNNPIVTPITETNSFYRKQDLSNSWCDFDDDNNDHCGVEDDILSTSGTLQKQLHLTEEDNEPTTSDTLQKQHHTKDSGATQSDILQTNLSIVMEDEEGDSDTSYFPPKPLTDRNRSPDDDAYKSPTKKRPRLFKTYTGVRKTWTTPERVQTRQLFREYIGSLEPPTLEEVRTILSGQPHAIDRRADKVHSWVFAEIQRKIKLKRGVTSQRWTTPQKHKLMQYFSRYFDQYQKTKLKNYPSKQELELALKKVSEFRNKSAEKLRSKIQHIFNLMDSEKI